MRVFVVTVLAFACQVLVVNAGYEPVVIDLPGDQDLESARVFTDEEIAQYDGSDGDKPLYMAVKGVVFDVSTGSKFYGKGASYNALTGKDSSRAVAKMTLEEDDLTSDISDLPERTLKSLDDVYKSVYLAKYPVAGYMDYLMRDFRQRKKNQDERSKQDL